MILDEGKFGRPIIYNENNTIYSNYITQDMFTGQPRKVYPEGF
jgi:hypothetical protein